MWIRSPRSGTSILALLTVIGWASMGTPAEGAPLGAAARAALAKGQPLSVLVEYDSSATDRSIAAARAARGLIRDDAALLLQRSQAYAALKSGVDPAIAQQGGIKLRDYRYLPLALWRISSLSALARIEQLPSVRMVHENIMLHPVSVSDLGFISQPDNIVSINMSLGNGTSNASPCTTSVFRTAVTNATAAGITVVAAAGNSGSKTGLGSPACTPGAVSVGAVYDSSYGTIEWDAAADSGGVCTDVSAPDLVTCFSQSASYLTVLAPGTFVDAPSAAFQESGTSQATPHISGAVAVLRALYPAEPLTETVQRLQITGPVDTDPANDMSSHRLNLFAAVNQGTSVSLSGTGPSTAVSGTNATYTLTATNGGPLAATDVRVVDALPAGAQFVSASSGCTYAAGTVTCRAATLGVGANVTFSIVVLWTSSGPVYDSSSVAADQLDSAPQSQQMIAFGVAPSFDGGVDGPLPVWAYALLAALLLAIATRRRAPAQ